MLTLLMEKIVEITQIDPKTQLKTSDNDGDGYGDNIDRFTQNRNEWSDNDCDWPVVLTKIIKVNLWKDCGGIRMISKDPLTKRQRRRWNRRQLGWMCSDEGPYSSILQVVLMQMETELQTIWMSL